MNNKYQVIPCTTDQRMSDAVRLRYLAYKNAGAIDENEQKEFRDSYDLLPNSKTGIVYENDGAVASVRACIYSREHNFLKLPGFEVYKADIEQELGLDKVIVESNRFVIDPAKVDSKDLFKIPFRFIILHLLKFNADYIITAVRPKHIPIYRRFLRLEPISVAKKYPGINVEMVMMAGDCRALLSVVMEREEIFRFTGMEVDDYLFTASPASVTNELLIQK